MRALSGAIIAAGGLVGLGLTAVGYGLRFQGYGPEALLHPQSHQLFGLPTLVLILVVLLLSSVIGLGAAFLGLAFHHERRLHEKQKHMLTPPGTHEHPVL